MPIPASTRARIPSKDRAADVLRTIRWSRGSITLRCMERHFTVTGFVVDGARTALHWHPKLSLWLPPGGHIDPNEDPVQAVLREVLEETGITAEIVPHRQPYTFRNVTQLPSPFSMIVADVVEPQATHQHIDLAYVVRPVAGAPVVAAEKDHGFIWVTEAELRTDAPLPAAPLRVISCGVEAPIARDVREVALAAIALVREAADAPSGPC